MKTRSLILVGVLIIALVAMAAPAMAVNTASIEGNPTATVALDVTGTNAAWSLAVGANSKTDLDIVVSSNYHFTVKAKDAMTAPKDNVGKMVEFDGTNYIAGSNHLTNPLLIDVTTTNGITGSDVTDSLDAAGKTIFSFPAGTGAYQDQKLEITFTQQVVYADPRLSGGSTYHIPITFDIATAA
jgi:hypothetical protein